MSNTAAFESSKAFAAQAKPSIFTILACQSYNDIGKPAFDHLFRYRWSILAKYINPGNSISDLLFNPAFCVLGIPTPGAAYLRTTTRYILRWTWYCNGALWRVSMPLSLKSSMESPGHHQVWSQNISFPFYSGTFSLSKSPFIGREKEIQ